MPTGDGDLRRPFHVESATMQTGWLYPGGAHRTWGKTKVLKPYRGIGVNGPEPSGAARLGVRATAEEKQRLKAGERLHSTDPSDPWAIAVWSPCEADCPIHNQ